MIKTWIKKLINIPIIQVSFMYMLKISAIKKYKNQCYNHCKNHRQKYKNAKFIKLANNKYKENECKTMQNFSNFCSIFLKQFVQGNNTQHSKSTCTISKKGNLGCFKGGLSGRMTWQFSNALELFSTQKIKLSNFRFCLIFIFNKKELQSCPFATY